MQNLNFYVHKRVLYSQKMDYLPFSVYFFQKSSKLLCFYALINIWVIKNSKTKNDHLSKRLRKLKSLIFFSI